MGFLTLFVAIAISAVAAWYSILGLMAIFSAAVVPIAIMGGVLEVGKLVTASWLYQYWTKAPRTLKGYLTTAVVVLMLITSMGIFGFLSKAHIDQTILTGDNTLQIQQVNNQIKREMRIIKDADKVIAQLDSQVQTLIDFDRIRGPSGSIATRKSQQKERSELNELINGTTIRVVALQSNRAKFEKAQLKLEAEVGPIRYVAEFIYGEKADRVLLESAVRWVIIVIIFVFDPLAILLLIAANMTIKEDIKRRKAKRVRQRNYNNKRNKSKKEVIERTVYPSEDGNAIQVKDDPYLANTQVWEDLPVVIKPKEKYEPWQTSGQKVQTVKVNEDSGNTKIIIPENKG